MAERLARVRDEALEVGRGWSGPDAPASWGLTAALFEVLAADEDLLALAAEIPPERLPALLFVASVQYAVARHPGEPFSAYFPASGAQRQPPLDERFPDAYHAFCLAFRDELPALWRRHRYQMNEVARNAQIALGLAALGDLAPGRPVALVDLGTAAGFGLLPDAYRYDLGDGQPFGAETSPVDIRCALQGPRRPRCRQLPVVDDRIGVDVNPIDLNDAEARAWLRACLPPETATLARADGAIDLVRDTRPTIVPGPALEVLPGLLDAIADRDLICVTDAYTAVFLDDGERQQLRDVIGSHATGRDIAWISLDPLVPLGPNAERTVHGAVAPERLIEWNRLGGVFGVLSLTMDLGGAATTRLLATAHPSGTRMEWLDGGAGS